MRREGEALSSALFFYSLPFFCVLASHFEFLWAGERNEGDNSFPSFMT